MTTPATRWFSAVTLPFVLLVASAALDGQTPEPISVLVTPVAMAAGPNLGRAVTTEVAALIDGMPNYSVVEWDALLDASVVTSDLNEERRAQLSNCIAAQQLAHAENIDLVLCSQVQALRTGFGVQTLVVSMASGGEHRFPSATVEDRGSVVRHVVAGFEEWTQEVRGRR